MSGAAAARVIGEFAEELDVAALPEPVVHAAQSLILDAVGTAVAASREDFAVRAERALTALAGDAPGDATVVGRSTRLPLRDAVTLNGVLVHGLDFDDTHPPAVLHPTASALPAVLGLAERHGLTGGDILLGYVLAVEVTTRLGAAASGAFHLRGFHPTGVLGVFGAAVAAARLTGLSAQGIATAQGVAGSLASGLLEFIGDGAWTKRLHPGWAAASGITAAALAAEDFVAPDEIYEGRYGLYASFLGTDHGAALKARLDTLGTVWETRAVAVKPYPACHFVHAFVDAAIALAERHDLDPERIEQIHCLIAEEEIPSVFEPLPVKRRPRSAYEAQFSVPHAVASALTRRRFTRDELTPAVRGDPVVRELARRTTYGPDPDSLFPRAFSGEVRIRLDDGSLVTHREQVNRGALERPLSPAEIRAKFDANIAGVLSPDGADELARLVAALPELDDPAPLFAALAP
ncbi:MmgE/PrpD family protein [Jiangella asiatica]|uniref:MmgE/PrpD family protein n=1 Tax=Jiangella asiatica TaxID=2530372 RepID=UPI00193EB8A5|nr:MmgE/PrpD family protein [Jiangella asiatica]